MKYIITFYAIHRTSIPILALLLVIIAIFFAKLIKFKRTLEPEKVNILWVWLIGLIGFLTGFFIFLYDLKDVLIDIFMAGDAPLSFYSVTIKYSLYNILIGALTFTISLILWGILKSIQLKKMQKS